MMEEAMSISFNGAPLAYLNEFKEFMGVTLSYSGYLLNTFTSVIILIATGIVFYLLSVFNLSKKSR